MIENSQDIEQFLRSIYRYVQLGVLVRGRQDKETKRFVREIGEVTEFYVTEDNEPKYNVIYRKTPEGKIYRKNPSKYLIDYIEGQGVELPQGFINPNYDGEDSSSDSNLLNKVSTEKIQNVNNSQVVHTVNPILNQAKPVVSNVGQGANQNYQRPMLQPLNNVNPTGM